MKERHDQWGGVRKDTAPHAVPDGFFQDDIGSDRFYLGVWRRRKGLLRTDLAKLDALSGTYGASTLLSFELPGGGFALLVCQGTDVDGFTSVGESAA